MTSGHGNPADRVEVHVLRVVQGVEQMRDVPAQASERVDNDFLVLVNVVPAAVEQG
jgi:hypothetical protein